MRTGADIYRTAAIIYHPEVISSERGNTSERERRKDLQYPTGQLLVPFPICKAVIVPKHSSPALSLGGNMNRLESGTSTFSSPSTSESLVLAAGKGMGEGRIMIPWTE